MEYIPIVSTAAAVFGAIFKSFLFVKTGEVGVLTTFGKASRNSDGKVKLVGEGFKLIIPFIQSIVRVHTKKNTEQFNELFVTLKNGVSYKFNAFIIYHVIPLPDAVENVLFTLSDYKEFVKITFERAIQTTLESAKDTISSERLSETLRYILYDTLHKEGIELCECGLVSFTATEQSQQLLGLDYKVSLAKNRLHEVGANVMCSILGATPTVTTNEETTIVQQPAKDDE